MIKLTGSEDFTVIEVNGVSFSCPQAAASEIERLRSIEKAATDLLTRKDEGPSENAQTFAEWDTLRDTLKGEDDAEIN